jgi:trigger factor
MQVSIETTSGLERRLNITLPAKQIDGEVETRLKQSVGKVRLDGFRPGKVPMSVMRKRFGGGVREEVLQDAMNKSLQDAFAQEKLQPAGMPSIETKNVAPGVDVSFVAIFEIYPDVELADISKLVINKPVAEVKDEDVDTLIELLRKQAAELTLVERVAKEGDSVNIDFAGTKDGEAFDGGSAEGSDLVLGSKSMIDGFEAAIEGMSAGDEKDTALKFPDDYHAKDLAGADVSFKITVNSVSEPVLADLDDEFFTKFGVAEGGLDGFKTEVRSNMERELEKATKAKLKTQVMDGLIEAHLDIQVPTALIAQEIEALRQRAMQQFGGAAASMDIKSMLPDDLFQEEATRQARLGLILRQFIESESIVADPDKVKAIIETEASTYEDPQEVVDMFYSNQQQLQQVQGMVLEDTVVEKILEVGQVTEQQMSYEEVVTPQQAAS